jgi:NADH-quinone oxidoreductase subunit H
MITTLFLGGWLGPILPPLVWVLGEWLGPVLSSLAWFTGKTLAVAVSFFLMRASLPRPRFDQLMAWGWKVLLPLALLNLLITGGVVLAIS